MKNTTTLLVISPDTTDAVIADLAESAFQEQTHLSCLLICLNPALQMYAYSASPYSGMTIPDNWAEITLAAQQSMMEREAEIKAVLARSDVSADVESVLCSSVEIKDIVARRARVCDIAHIPAGTDESNAIRREAAHGVLFRSPVGLMLNASPSMRPDCVFVAWNNSETAARAVHLALPYLCAAKEVIIACFDPRATPEGEGEDPGTDVATWLSRHGCNVTVSQFPTGGQEVGQCIIDRAREQSADLVVMGAYGHARMREAIFGGTTRTMLAETQLPVLLAH
jgi:nucleotide-binding universal stress UspA family protein